MELKVRGLYFSAGHRIAGHPYCHKPHGHTYFVDVTYVASIDEKLDEMGMIIDFGDLKDGIKNYLKSYWDHYQIIPNDPEEIDAWTELYHKLDIDVKWLKPLKHTTSEYIAMCIKEDLQFIFAGAQEIRVEVYEGPMQGVTV